MGKKKSEKSAYSCLTMLDLGCTHARFDCPVLPLGAIVNPLPAPLLVCTHATLNGPLLGALISSRCNPFA